MTDEWWTANARPRGAAARGRSRCATTSSPTSRSTGAWCCARCAQSCAIATGTPAADRGSRRCERSRRDAPCALRGVRRRSSGASCARRFVPTGCVVLTDLESQTDFDTNRTGLVVLHPPALAGTALRITHAAAAQWSRPHSPTSASVPTQPAFDITALSWTDPAGLRRRRAFRGRRVRDGRPAQLDGCLVQDVQQTPRALPYRLAAGERVVQSVEVRVSGAVAAEDDNAPARIRLEPGVPLPHIAVSASSAPRTRPLAVELVGAVTLVELDLATRTGAPRWRAAASARPLEPPSLRARRRRPVRAQRGCAHCAATTSPA